jgi:hypothetical protein
MYDAEAIRLHGAFAKLNFLAEVTVPPPTEIRIVERAAPRKGENGPMAKITMIQAREIRQRYATERISQTALAAHYGVSQPLISAIVLNKIWKDA